MDIVVIQRCYNCEEGGLSDILYVPLELARLSPYNAPYESNKTGSIGSRPFPIPPNILEPAAGLDFDSPIAMPGDLKWDESALFHNNVGVATVDENVPQLWGSR